jgi:arylsulfatase A
MNRALLALPLLLAGACAHLDDEPARPPNIVFVLADDLGYGELGSYGQEKIRTPRLDALAEQGMRFTQHYSGSPVCAPSRCVLLTGYHTGHAFIRDNDKMSARGDVWNDPELEGQRPIPDETFTLAELLRAQGYATAAIGKWGLGWTGSSGDPNRQGFDLFYGYICQRVAHNYYPTHLWHNDRKVPLDNPPFRAHQRLPEGADPDDPASYAGYAGADYAADFMVEAALDFVRDNAERPFFLYFPTPVPHLALQVPEDSLAEYAGAFEETPYTGGRSYLPHRTPRAAYAAMITRMDRDVGRILDLIDELELRDDTIVVFSSDNGPSWVGGVDKDYFASQGGLRGRKGQLFEGGIRVPAIVRWPGRVAEGSSTDLPSAFWDWMPTLGAVAGAEVPEGLDGVSLLPTLTGRPDRQQAHDHLYWEYAKRMQAVRQGDWKAFRPKPDAPLQLYDLAADPAETTDVAAEHPEVVARLERLLTEARTESEFFPLGG